MKIVPAKPTPIIAKSLTPGQRFRVHLDGVASIFLVLDDGRFANVETGAVREQFDHFRIEMVDAAPRPVLSMLNLGDASWFYGAAVTQVSNAAALLRREVESERRRADWNEQRWRTVAQLYDKERDQRQQAEGEVQQLKLCVADLESFRDRSKGAK